MIVAQPVDITQIVLAMITAAPAFIAACVAAGLSWHNRTLNQKSVDNTNATKSMVNGRMDELLRITKENAELRGAQKAELSMTNVINAAKNELGNKPVAVTIVQDEKTS